MTPAAHPPLILTLKLDPASQDFFERERRRWFPPARNFIPAHVTLFHHLPGDNLPRIQHDLQTNCRRQQPSPFSVTGLRFLGRGVAYVLEAPAIATFRAELAASWQADLTAQDKQTWRPHVTVQNKADPAAARALHTRLAAEFAPFHGVASGVVLWRYLGGPWALEADIAFKGASASF